MTPLIIPLDEPDDPALLVHLLHESADDARAREVAEDVLDALAEDLTSEPVRGESLDLTNRELEVLRLVALSLDTGQIAEDLHLSGHTVLNHIRNARAKLHARNRLDGYWRPGVAACYRRSATILPWSRLYGLAYLSAFAEDGHQK